MMATQEELKQERTDIKNELNLLAEQCSLLVKDSIEYTAVSTAMIALRIRFAQVQKAIIAQYG